MPMYTEEPCESRETTPSQIVLQRLEAAIHSLESRLRELEKQAQIILISDYPMEEEVTKNREIERNCRSFVPLLEQINLQTIKLESISRSVRHMVNRMQL